MGVAQTFFVLLRMFQSDHVSLSHHDMHSSSMRIIVQRPDVYQQITNISWVFYSPRVIINMGAIRKVLVLGVDGKMTFCIQK